MDFVGRMVQDVSDKDIFFNLKNLLERDNQLDTRLKSIFEEAGFVAQETGLNLSLPALSPRFNRRCEFIEEGRAFVSWDGFIHPCYFLWHTYSCFVTEWQKYVNAQEFGTVTKES